MGLNTSNFLYKSLNIVFMLFLNNLPTFDVIFQFFHPPPWISKRNHITIIANALSTKFDLNIIIFDIVYICKVLENPRCSSYFSDPHDLNRFINTTLESNFSKHLFEQILDHKPICTFLSVIFSDRATPIFCSLLSWNTRWTITYFWFCELCGNPSTLNTLHMCCITSGHYSFRETLPPMSWSSLPKSKLCDSLLLNLDSSSSEKSKWRMTSLKLGLLLL